MTTYNNSLDFCNLDFSEIDSLDFTFINELDFTV